MKMDPMDTFAIIYFFTVGFLCLLFIIVSIGFLVTELRLSRERRQEALLTEQVQAKKRKAEERGTKLLMRLLTPEQQREYETTYQITLPVADGYQATIGKSISGVRWQTADGQTHHQCVFVQGASVHVDDTIGKLLALRTDPEALAWVSGLKLNHPDFGRLYR